MDFKAAREAKNLTLKQASELAGYSVPTINALELEGRGSDRLKEKLAEVYGGSDSMVLREAAPESEIVLWRRRAKTAEAELARLRAGLRTLLEPGSSSAKTNALAIELGNAVVDAHDTEHKPARG